MCGMTHKKYYNYQNITNNPHSKKLIWGRPNYTCKLKTSNLFLLQRNEMREQKGIDGSTGSDALAAICCTPCVAVQVANELDHYEK